MALRCCCEHIYDCNHSTQVFSEINLQSFAMLQREFHHTYELFLTLKNVRKSL